jgi:outer membrane protein OmpA-like peptidoglycan-associated protein
MIKRTKYIAIVIFLTVAGMKLQAQTENAADKIHWYSFEDGARLNAQTHKKVFIDIFTDWCGWCKELDRSTFTNPSIVKLMNDNFIAVKLNAERKDTIYFNGYMFVNPNPNGNRSPNQLASSMLKGKMMYPSMVFMDDSMRIITTVQSFLKPLELEPILAFISENQYNKVNFDTFKMGYKPITIETPHNFILNKVSYKQGGYTLENSSFTQLDSMLNVLKQDPVMKIEIDGYTDNVGDAAANKTLSENRAKAVYDYMLGKGADVSRMTYAGFGPLNPVADNATSAGQNLNRRVEIKILSK